MKRRAPIKRHEWIHLLLSALTGVILSTGLTALLVTEKAGALTLAYWQIAGIYVAIVGISVWVGINDLRKHNPPRTQQTILTPENKQTDDRPANG
jgi:hypothetical protein